MQRTSEISVSVERDRPRLSHVRIELLDDVEVFLLHDAAFEFERESEAAIVEREVFGEQREALDRFVLRKVRSEAPDFSFNETAHKRMRSQLLRRCELNAL